MRDRQRSVLRRRLPLASTSTLSNANQGDLLQTKEVTYKESGLEHRAREDGEMCVFSADVVPEEHHFFSGLSRHATK